MEILYYVLKIVRNRVNIYKIFEIEYNNTQNCVSHINYVRYILEYIIIILYPWLYQVYKCIFFVKENVSRCTINLFK